VTITLKLLVLLSNFQKSPFVMNLNLSEFLHAVSCIYFTLVLGHLFSVPLSTAV
jgi:hypothetical protein